MEAGAGDKVAAVAASGCKIVAEAGTGDKAKAAAAASGCKMVAFTSPACEQAKKSWDAAAASTCKAVRDAAARYKAEQAAGKKGATRMERMSQHDIDLLIANSKKPRPELRVRHEFIDSMTCASPETREGMRAAMVMTVANLQALRDWEAELIRRYHADGYVEVEVEEEDYTDDETLWRPWIKDT